MSFAAWPPEYSGPPSLNPTWQGFMGTPGYSPLPTNTWLWVKHMCPKWNPRTWRHGPKPGVSWWFNFDPYPCVTQGRPKGRPHTSTSREAGGELFLTTEVESRRPSGPVQRAGIPGILPCLAGLALFSFIRFGPAFSLPCHIHDLIVALAIGTCTALHLLGAGLERCLGE